MRLIFTNILLLLAFLLPAKVLYGQNENAPALNKIISIDTHEETIATVLDLISQQANVFFSYDASLFKSDEKASISVSGKTVRETLSLLFNQKFSFKTLGNQIIIMTNIDEAATNADNYTSQVKPTTITFRGKITDRDGQEVLPYASIYVLGQNIGTVSNNDGEFALKIPGQMLHDTVIVSSMGYAQYTLPISELTDKEYLVALRANNVQIKEIKVTAIGPEKIIDQMTKKIPLNYPRANETLTSFYREVLKQDNKYIDVAEALMEIRKSSYDNPSAQDRAKVIKGRKSLNVSPFKFVDFKIQGGPYYITKLDVIKTPDSFLDPEFREFYKYAIVEIVEIDKRDTYVISFKPKDKVDYPCYQGLLYIDMSSFALVKAEYVLSRPGLKFARESLIKKKPKDFYVRPIYVGYKVNYRKTNGYWHLSTAQASLKFRVRSKLDKVNSIFHTDSELLITDIKSNNSTRYKRDEIFGPNDVFTETIEHYDDGFWGDYNIIKPSEELRKSLIKYSAKSDSLFPGLKNNDDQE